jgi:hypothetical protein
VKSALAALGDDVKSQFHMLDKKIQLGISQAEDLYTGLMQALTDEAKEGRCRRNLCWNDSGALQRHQLI